MRKIVAYVATSADGYIARNNGDVAWLDRPRPKGNYGMGDFYKSVDTAVMGRATYAVAGRLGQPLYPGKRNVVFSRTLEARQAPGIEVARGSVKAFVRRLRDEPGTDVWLVGGAALMASFLDADALDELIVHVVPVLIGEGIPLFAPRRRDVPLRLRESRSFRDGVVRLHYDVARPDR